MLCSDSRFPATNLEIDMKKFITFTIASLLTVTFTLSAQDKPREIFDYNYVKDGFNGRPSTVKKNKYKDGQAINNSKSTKQDTPSATNNAEIKSGSDIAALKEDSKRGGKGLNVTWVSLLVNALDKQHFHAELDRFQKLAVKNDFDIMEVIGIGPTDYSKEVESKMVKFSARGGKLHYKPELPKKYEITRSPALVVGTADGLHILEGVSNYDRYFNNKAEFIQ